MNRWVGGVERARVAHRRPPIRARIENPLPPHLVNQVMAYLPRSRTRTMVKKRKRTRSRGRGRIGRAVSLWPASRLVKFKVVTAFSVAADVAGQLKSHTVKLNSLNDPTGGLSAQLPLGVDQWAAMYRRYCVVGATVFVKVHNVTSTGGVSYGLSVLEPGNTTAFTEASSYLELPRTKSRILSPDMDHSGLGISWSAKKSFKVAKIKDARELHGDFSTAPGDPTSTCVAHFWHHDINATENYTLEGYLTVEYICLLTDRILPARSSL